LPTHDIIVIGGSAGALGGLKRILQSLPPGFTAAIFVVIHTATDSAGIFPSLLSKAGPLPAFAALGGTPIRLGAIYLARLTTICSFNRRRCGRGADRWRKAQRCGGEWPPTRGTTG
jgi:two-component system chemotaxis response regulator CheB